MRKVSEHRELILRKGGRYMIDHDTYGVVEAEILELGYIQHSAAKVVIKYPLRGTYFEPDKTRGFGRWRRLLDKQPTATEDITVELFLSKLYDRVDQMVCGI